MNTYYLIFKNVQDKYLCCVHSNEWIPTSFQKKPPKYLRSGFVPVLLHRQTVPIPIHFINRMHVDTTLLYFLFHSLSLLAFFGVRFFGKYIFCGRQGNGYERSILYYILLYIIYHIDKKYITLRNIGWITNYIMRSYRSEPGKNTNYFIRYVQYIFC